MNPLDSRDGVTRKFSIRSADGSKLKLYATANLYPDGRLREVFLRADKVGSFAAGVLDAFAIALSLGLQHGVPLKLLLGKLRHLRFDPSGVTGDAEFPMVASVVDYVCQWLERKFVPPAATP